MELEVFTTYGGGSWQEQFHQKVAFQQDPGIENKVVNLYPEITYEELEGFGGAITDSAAYVYSLMNEQQKKQLIETYFSPEKMNYQIIRIHMDSCDFSLEQYEAMSDPNDEKMESFSLERSGKYIFPMLEDIQKQIGRSYELMLSPWSPPAFMKTTGKREHGGYLKKEYRGMWAEYLCRYILEFKKRGYLIRRITLQNEPHAVQPWDSCVFDAKEQKEFLRDYMYPAMVRNNLQDIEVFLWDHNKERVYEWMRDAIDEDTDVMVAGAAFHWYSGDHFEALNLVRQQFPDKKLIVSESCIEFYKFDPANVIHAAISLSHEIIGDLNHGMTAFYDWNLLLDENGGPNYVENYCLAPFLYNTQTKKLQPQLIQQYFEHFSHYILPGSIRIAFTKYTENIDVTAWKRPDGKLAIVLLNKSEQSAPVCVRMEGQAAETLLYPQSITSCIVEI